MSPSFNVSWISRSFQTSVKDAGRKKKKNSQVGLSIYQKYLTHSDTFFLINSSQTRQKMPRNCKGVIKKINKKNIERNRKPNPKLETKNKFLLMFKRMTMVLTGRHHVIIWLMSCFIPFYLFPKTKRLMLLCRYFHG